jgi:polypyrimidine tract-binding protein 2
MKRCNYECEIRYGNNHKYTIHIYLFQNASAQAALQAASALSGQNETQGGPNTVLRVIVEHMVYPVTLEVLCQVSGNSCVLKCIFHSLHVAFFVDSSELPEVQIIVMLLATVSVENWM